MGPSRKAAISDPSSSTSASSSHPKKMKRPQHKKHPAPAPSASTALPGVQKIKASLRQTRRLLAKDNLAADVRVATERRLKSLEGDLARAEQARVERTMATRYHKVKFFERQKVVRRIAQTKKQLEGATEKKERKKLEKQMAELRVDLNYVLHYPKTKKYISLFPPEVRHGQEGGKEEAKDQGVLETDRQREEIKQWVREQMEAGALSTEPEIELGKADGQKPDTPASHIAKKNDPSKVGEDTRDRSAGKAKRSGVADDEFFAMDDGEGSESGEEGQDSEMDED